VRERIEAAKLDWIPATVLMREIQAQGYAGGISQLKPLWAAHSRGHVAALGWHSLRFFEQVILHRELTHLSFQCGDSSKIPILRLSKSGVHSRPEQKGGQFSVGVDSRPTTRLCVSHQTTSPDSPTATGVIVRLDRNVETRRMPMYGAGALHIGTML
jgi:hypothetical protein